jgi:hypothetical protein
METMIMETFINFLKAFTPILSVILPTYLAYRFGLLQSRNEKIAKRKIEIGEKLGETIQTVIENTRYSHWFYKRTFREMGLNEAMERMERHRALYVPVIERIVAGEAAVESARELLKTAKIYIKNKHLQDIGKYLELQEFVFQSDVTGEIDYLDKYFENIIDEEKNKLRNNLEKKIVNNLTKLVA